MSRSRTTGRSGKRRRLLSLVTCHITYLQENTEESCEESSTGASDDGVEDCGEAESNYYPDSAGKKRGVLGDTYLKAVSRFQKRVGKVVGAPRKIPPRAARMRAESPRRLSSSSEENQTDSETPG